jgi:two-component system phosphate regulon sensor histidine kinase PhoR
MKRRLLLTYLLIAALCICLTAALMFHSIQKTYRDTVEQQLTHTLDAAAAWLHESMPQDVSGWMDKHRQDFGCRVTIIGPDGWVVADTETDPETMDNHSGRPEIMEALSQGSGASIRHSDTLDMDMLYVARRLNGDGTVIRAATPLSQSFRERNLLFANLAGVLAAALILSVFLGSRFANTISRPILDMALVSQEMARGDFSKRISVRGTREVRNLATSFNQMADSLQRTITDLENKKNQLTAILQSMDSGVVAVDDKYNVILLNPAAEVFFDIHEPPIGRYFLRMCRDTRMEDVITRTLTERSLQVQELETIGTPRHVLRVTGSPIISDGSILGAVLLIQDITELRQLEKVRKDFVANVTHELKTPLTSIKGFLETLQSGAIEDTRTARKFLSIIDIETERLYRLINDILTLSKLEGMQIGLDIRSVTLKDVVGEVFDMLAPLADEKNIRLHYTEEPKGSKIRAVRDRIKELILNLVDNSVKYTPSGGEVRMHIAEAGPRIVIAVQDTGIGIDKKHIPRLFERFYRVDRGRSREMGGTGLGLAIVKHIVLSMGGSVDVESQPGRGSTFTITLPKSFGD